MCLGKSFLEYVCEYFYKSKEDVQEWDFFCFTSIKDMFDGGGAGGSGSEYSAMSHSDYLKNYENRHGHSDPNAKRYETTDRYVSTTITNSGESKSSESVKPENAENTIDYTGKTVEAELPINCANPYGISCKNKWT